MVSVRGVAWAAVVGAMVLLAMVVAPGAVLAWGGGVLTADVELTVPGVNGGNPFAAVINPDYGELYGAGLVNATGVFTGDRDAPDTFSYVDVPIYAIVPYDTSLVIPLPETFVPWDYAEPLFGTGGSDDRLFSFAPVGRMTLHLQHDEGGLYTEDGGVYAADVNDDYFYFMGSITFGLPPGGWPNYLWYGVNEIDFGQAVIINQNDSKWESSGWPGVTLDKNFFPTPEPATLSLLALGGLMALRRRR